MTTVSLGLPLRRRASKTAVADRPDSPFLIDSHGRRARDLRVSLTDRCNLRCTYCMPEQGLDWLPDDRVLSDAELLRLLRIAVTDLGIEEIRFTGGEPLLRKGIVDLIGATTALTPRPEVSLTTNGIGLARRAADLAAAGLDRVNISLDTLRPETFTTLTRRRRHADVIAALAAASDAGLRPVKINTVLMRGVNDDEAGDLLDFALTHGYHLRFIEQMPLDAGHVWNRQDMVTADEIQQRLTERFELLPHPAPRDGAPAELFDVARRTVDEPPERVAGTPERVLGTERRASGASQDAVRDERSPRRAATPERVLGTVGIIASVTRPFCGDCDRTRLTADGQIRNCLFARTETDLRGLLRAGADDRTIADAWRTAMWGKLPGHGIDDPSFLQPDRPMSAIGG